MLTYMRLADKFCCSNGIFHAYIPELGLSAKASSLMSKKELQEQVRMCASLFYVVKENYPS